MNLFNIINMSEFAEAHAFGVYTIYAAKLREAGMIEAAMKMEELASNEKEHLERWMFYNKNQPTDPIEIMDKVIGMETNDSNTMYSQFLAKAEEMDAPDDIIVMLRRLIKIEARHARLISDLKQIYQGEDPEAIAAKRKGKWVCPHCGNFYYSQDAIPDKCPVCEHDKADYVWQEA